MSLAVADLRQAWLRPGLAALAIGLGILVIAFFARQIELRQSEVLAGYEAAGAATFVVQLSGINDDQVDALANSARRLANVRSVETPYSGITGQFVADTSFLVFRNQQQQEYLGARTSVLGVDARFDLARDYYVDFHDLNPASSHSVLGMPLLGADGVVRAPQPGEILVPSEVADYVGVRPGAEAIVELAYTGGERPVVRRLEGLRLIGTFELVGPDQGRFDPFWRFNSRAQDVLTVRPPDGNGRTTLPIVLSQQAVEEFLAYVRRELVGSEGPPLQFPSRDQIVVRAASVGAVPAAEADADRLLREGGLSSNCDWPNVWSFCVRLPERNNFQTALAEQTKVGTGGAFFLALLLVLLAVGTAGLEIQVVLRRWRDYGVLQAVGFSPGPVFLFAAVQLAVIIVGGAAIAACASVLLPSASVGSLMLATGFAIGAAVVAAAPALAWPLWRPAAELLREAA